MTSNDIFELIVKNTRNVIPMLDSHTFARTDSLKELGANSIDRSEIVIMTLEDANCSISLVEVAGAANMGELADLIYAKTNQV
jgi:polyketide biosynthesis acyl carrier protein